MKIIGSFPKTRLRRLRKSKWIRELVSENDISHKDLILPIFIIVGYQARISAGLLAIFCILTAFIFHFDFTDQTQFILFLKNIGLAGGFLFIVANGTKEWSVDKEKKYVRL